MLTKKFLISLFLMVTVLFGAYKIIALFMGDEFVMCRKHREPHFPISIDFLKKEGVYEGDMMSPILSCEKNNFRCIKFPFLFSSPPRYPQDVKEIIRWNIVSDAAITRDLGLWDSSRAEVV